jgi:DNA-binding transcriptional ArsR family regulator
MPTISNHLKILREAEIITVTKEDRYMNYKLNANNGVVRDVLDLLNDLCDTQIESDKNKALKIDRINIC